ncbi:MAG: 8-amino-7-oxononanoate synthase [Bacteroidales bacterium]|nr:8-amino-7-oxononanoate synthase [Bacteroidales bacterium]
MSLFDRWTTALDGLRKLDRFRTLRLPVGHDFTSNDYLGYGSHPRIEDAGTSAFSRSGIASRLLRGHHAVWEQVEAALAQWHGAESVQMMTSGYVANEGLLATICEPGDWVAYDELSHACIAEGLRSAKCRRYSFRHNDLAHLEEGLAAEAAKNDPQRARFVVTESLFSMDGDLAPLPAMADLCKRYSAYLIVDEAHSTGCYGENGSGYVDACGLRGQVLATMHTGGKALGVPGAYLAGPRLLKDYLINRCRHLIFTTALPPECGRWWLEMLPQVQADTAGRTQLHANTALFRNALTAAGVATLGSEYVVPVVLGDDGPAVTAAQKLQEAGFDVRAIRPPSVAPGTSRLRISIHANHSPTLIQELATATVAAVRAVPS